MTFLYPDFLWALTALSVPLIIHLFNFRKTQKIYFSNTRFIQQVQEATSSKRRLKHLVVLATRMLFIFFLVMVFAQPIIPAAEQLPADASMVLYLDNSQSMSAPMAGEVRALDVGTTVVRTIVENFPANTQYRLVTNDFDPFSNSLKTKDEILDRLAQIRLSGRSRTAEEVVNRIRKLGDEEEVFWVSDFQRATFGTFVNADTTQRFHLVPVQAGSLSNIFIDTAYLQNPFAIGGERNMLTVRLFNDGEEERGQVTIRLTLDNLQAGTATTRIPANAFSEVSFELPTQIIGFRKAVLTFSDAPITFDNEFYATLDFSDRLSVFEIKEESNQTVVETVFGNQTVFNFSSVSSKNVDYTKLATTDLLVLYELTTLDEPLLLAITNYLNAGGTLLLIPAAEPIIESYQRLLPMVQKNKQAQAYLLGKPDFTNPFFANVFQEQTTSLAMPLVKNVLEWGNDRQAILKQQDDKPYLSLFQNEGKIYVLGGPLQKEYGSFYNNALFVPVMYRIAASGKRDQRPLYNLLSTALVAVRSDSLQTNALLSLSGEEEFTPAQRRINQEFVLDLAGLEMKAGAYAVHNGTDTLSWLAFNQDTDESRLALMEDAVVQKTFGSRADVYQAEVQSAQAMAEALRKNYQGFPLWKYALVAGLFFLVVEVLLLRFWKS